MNTKEEVASLKKSSDCLSFQQIKFLNGCFLLWSKTYWKNNAMNIEEKISRG